eukprot:scaffold43974_cov18-Tisochrysis_lutea.AAC.1
MVPPTTTFWSTWAPPSFSASATAPSTACCLGVVLGLSLRSQAAFSATSCTHGMQRHEWNGPDHLARRGKQ